MINSKMGEELAPLDVPALLRSQGLRPDKKLGQNFLSNDVILASIVDAAGVKKTDMVLEIGAGIGSLTRHLARSARKVVAVEIDQKLIELLKVVSHPFRNVTIVQGDILRMDVGALMDQPGYVVAANIPYYITSALIRHLLETKNKPARITLTVQEEVAKRICASPGDLSLLALSVQVYGQPKIAARIPAGAFYPPPKVDSAVVRVDLYPEPKIPSEKLDLFFRVIKAGFSQKRKTLRNSLSAGLRLSPATAAGFLHAAGIDPNRRAETLTMDEWKNFIDQIQDVERG